MGPEPKLFAAVGQIAGIGCGVKANDTNLHTMRAIMILGRVITLSLKMTEGNAPSC